MSVAPEAKHRISLRPQDQRRFQRVDLNLLGRFMLEDRQEYPCQTRDISPGAVALVTPIKGKIGERVVAYIDHIGRLEGKIVRIFAGGFAMTINATPRKRDKLAAKLTWLVNRHELNLPEDRRHDRVTSPVTAVTVTMADGRAFKARVIDISQSGAALATDMQPQLGAQITVGQLRSTVVRHLEGGIAIEFANLQTSESLEQYLG